jgi:hypothetical protein
MGQGEEKLHVDQDYMNATSVRANILNICRLGFHRRQTIRFTRAATAVAKIRADVVLHRITETHEGHYKHHQIYLKHELPLPS